MAARNVAEALRRVPRPALGAVRTVAIARFDAGSGAVGVSFGSTQILNSLIETDRREVIETVIHEATHNYQHLVDGDLAPELWGAAGWSDAVREAAAKTVERYALQAGVTRVWASLQQSGVRFGLAGNYAADEWEALSNDEAARAGFASPYGASAPEENIR